MGSYDHPRIFARDSKAANERPPLTEDMIETAMLRARRSGYPIDAWRMFADQARDEVSRY